MQKHKIFAIVLTLVLVFSFSAIASAGKYNEAPVLEELVAAGELPAVEERLPVEPAVVEPLEEIGEYGGTMHVYTPYTMHLGDGEIVAYESVLRIDRDYSWAIPNIIKSYDFAEDGKSLVLYLREGMKWSDGYPFTADDFLYAYEYEALNKELTPNIFGQWKVGDEVVQVKKIDEYTVRLDFPKPYPLILNVLGHASGMQSLWPGFGCFQPAHYAKQFHPDFVGKEKATEMAKEAGFATWVEYYNRKVGSFFGVQWYPDASPSLAPYVCVERTMDRWVYERNPYYWKIDTDGNQLPYIDRVIVHLVGDVSIITGKIITGEADYVGMFTKAKDLPLYVDNAEKGGYRVLLWRSPGNIHVQLNLTSEDPVLREIFQDIRFRKALSLAMNREEMNKTFWFGLATPSSFTVAPFCEYYKEEYAKAYIEYDPERANKLLDEMGLTKKDKEGFRLRPDGERLKIVAEETVETPVVEALIGYWKDIGVDVGMRIRAASLLVERAKANKVDMRVLAVVGSDFNMEPTFSQRPSFFVPVVWEQRAIWCTRWAQWYVTEGEKGEKPPEQMMNLIDWYENLKLATTEEERIKWAQKLLKSQADNLWLINIVNMYPAPIIVKENLRNIPAKGLWTWDITRIKAFQPEQFFFKGAKPTE